MNYKKSKISFFTCIAMCSVGLLAQINALRGADEVEKENVVVTQVVEDVVVEPAKLELAVAAEVEDVVSIKKFLKTIESGDDSEELETRLNSLIRSVVGSPIPVDQYFEPLGLEIMRLVQRIESLRVFGRTVEPHASDYYILLPENLGADHRNLKYYQWLVQVVYVVQACLQNKEIDPNCLQASYSAYHCAGIKGYEWLQSAPIYFENIFKYLARNAESAENPYLCESLLSGHKRTELLAELAGRARVEDVVHPTKETLDFVVFNAKKGPDTLLSALGLSSENSVQILLDAITDKRLFTKDKPGFYDTMNRRLYTDKDGEAFVKHQIVLFYNHYTALPNADSLSWCATLLKGMAHIADAANTDEKLKSDYQQRLIDHKAAAPYLAGIGAEPESETERLSWSERLTEWKNAHQTEFLQWESGETALSRNYRNEHFMLRYNAILSRIDQDPAQLAQFIKEDFARLFNEKYIELDPSDLFQSMAYVTLLLNFKVCNLSHWNLIPNSTDVGSGGAKLQIASGWNYSLSPSAHDINVLRTVGADGQVCYLKLVRTNDYAGLAKAIRDERALGFPKITELSLNASSANAFPVGEGVVDATKAEEKADA